MMQLRALALALAATVTLAGVAAAAPTHPRIKANATMMGKGTRHGKTLNGFAPEHLIVSAPAGARVTLKCSRGGCKKTAFDASRPKVDLGSRFKKLLQRGTTVVVRITQDGYAGRKVVFTIKRGSFIRDDFDIEPPAPAPAPPPDPVTPPPPEHTPPAQAPTRKVIVVDNRVTNGAGMREDSTPARLTTQPWTFCGTRGCNIAGTERVSGQTYDAAECQTTGERTTNGNDSSSSDDSNPERFESSRYYGVKLSNGTFGYVSEVWIRSADRGGLGLPQC